MKIKKCSSLEKAICYRPTITTTARQFTDSVKGRVKSTGPSLKHENPSEAGETCDNTKWNFHYARSCSHHQYHPQRN